MVILVVEDEIKISSFIKRGLEMENYEVDVANDGNEGLKKAQANKYDLLIIDYMLPCIDGIEICKILKRNKINTPTLMLTARDISKDWLNDQDAGIDDYLIKPFIFNEFLARIKTLLKREKAAELA